MATALQLVPEEATAAEPRLTEGQPEQQQAQDYGVNNENLPDELQNALRNILKQKVDADSTARRWEVRKILQRRLYFRGDQYWAWAGESALFVPPSQWSQGTDEEEQESSFQHCVNIFQPTLLSLGSVMSQNRVPARFWPQNVQQPKDVVTAKNATRVVDWIHRNNRTNETADQVSYLLGTDGFVGAHIRYVSDGERYGKEDVPIVEQGEVELAPERYGCPECQEEYALEESEFGVCPQCGGDMELLPPVSVPVPIEAGTEQVAKGQEVISVWGALNLRRSMWADNQEDFEYLELQFDLATSAAIAMYPHLEAKLREEAGTLGMDDAYEATARRILYEGSGLSGMRQANLSIYRKAWLRPQTFYCEKDSAVRQQLFELFPNGVMVCFYGTQYCESRNESMDEKWTTMHGMPGEGQIRETFMSAIVALQDQANDLTNLHFEMFMHGVPEGFADESAIDWEQRKKQGALPGNLSPVVMSPNQDIRQKMYFTQATEPSAASIQYRDSIIGPIREFISGDTPILHGQQESSDQSGKALQILRNQALGRVGRTWRRLQEWWAQVDLKAVQCFARNRNRALELAILGPSGDFEGESLDPEELQGNVSAYPEVDRQYPILQMEVAQVLSTLFNGPLAQLLIAEPENLTYAMREFGLSEVKIPGEDSRKKQLREINDLLKSQPVPLPDGTGLGPSIVPDDVLDDHGVEERAGMEWANSDEGQKQRLENPVGFENVKLHILAHQMMRKQKELQEAIVAQAAQGGGPAADLGGAQDMPPPKEKANGEAVQ